MASAGDVLEDLVTGQRIVFEATAHETGGELLRQGAPESPAASSLRSTSTLAKASVTR